MNLWMQLPTALAELITFLGTKPRSASDQSEQML